MTKELSTFSIGAEFDHVLYFLADNTFKEDVVDQLFVDVDYNTELVGMDSELGEQAKSRVLTVDSPEGRITLIDLVRQGHRHGHRVVMVTHEDAEGKHIFGRSYALVEGIFEEISG